MIKRWWETVEVFASSKYTSLQSNPTALQPFRYPFDLFDLSAAAGSRPIARPESRRWYKFFGAADFQATDFRPG